MFLSVDANGGYTVEQAVWAAGSFEQLDVALFEQPTRRGDHPAMAEVRRRSGIPIMADESVFTPQDALEVIRHRAADVIEPVSRQARRRSADAADRQHGRGGRHPLHHRQQPGARGGDRRHGPRHSRHAQRHHASVSPATSSVPCISSKPLTQKPLRYEADRLFVPETPGLGVSVDPPSKM